MGRTQRAGCNGAIDTTFGAKGYVNAFKWQRRQEWPPASAV